MTLNTMLNQSARFYREIALMNWFVFHADGHASFITTDSPLGYVVDDEHRRSREPVLGFASGKVTKLVPLTSQTALVIGGPGVAFRHFPADRNQVREINMAVAIECERFVIARDEALIRSIIPASKVDCRNPWHPHESGEHPASNRPPSVATSYRDGSMPMSRTHLSPSKSWPRRAKPHPVQAQYNPEPDFCAG